MIIHDLNDIVFQFPYEYPYGAEGGEAVLGKQIQVQSQKKPLNVRGLSWASSHHTKLKEHAYLFQLQVEEKQHPELQVDNIIDCAPTPTMQQYCFFAPVPEILFHCFVFQALRKGLVSCFSEMTNFLLPHPGICPFNARNLF